MSRLPFSTVPDKATCKEKIIMFSFYCGVIAVMAINVVYRKSLEVKEWLKNREGV